MSLPLRRLDGAESETWTLRTQAWGQGFAGAGSRIIAPAFEPAHGWEYAIHDGLRFKYAPVEGHFLVGSRADTRPFKDLVAGFYDFASRWYPRELLAWVPHPSPWVLYGWSQQTGFATTVSTVATIPETYPASVTVMGWTAPMEAVSPDRLGVMPSAVQPHAQQSALDALEDALSRAAASNWDGYNAPPIEASAKAGAIRFLNLLGPEMAPPEVTLAPGAITFDWYRDPRWIFSVSISDERRAHYAGLFDTVKMSGTDQLTGALPEIIELGIRRASGGRGENRH